MQSNIVELSPGDIIIVNGELHKIKSISSSPYSIEDEHYTFASGYIPSLITMHAEYIHHSSPRAEYLRDPEFDGICEKTYYKKHYLPNIIKPEKPGLIKSFVSWIHGLISNK